MIEVKNLSRIFNKGKRNEVKACDDISMKLEDTGFYVIFGKSGAGKSSLMNALGGLDDFSSGSITYDDKTFKHMVSDKCRVANIGYIFQNYCLDANNNVYDNVALGLRSVGIRDEEVIFNRTMTALANVGLTKYFRRNVTTLSGGQQQRVAIARAMAKGSRIILADEPTGNLDEENTRIVMNILKELSKTRLVIVVTHEEDLVATYADKIIEIHDGKIKNESDGLSQEYAHTDKNKIFISELEKNETSLGNITIEQYGEDFTVNIKVINDHGKLYLKADNANIKILDAKSEVKIVEGTREEYKERQKQDMSIQLQGLDPIIPKSSGKVFRYKDCVPNAKQKENKKYKRRNRFLKITLSLLVVVIIALSAYWGALFNQKELANNFSLGNSIQIKYKSPEEFDYLMRDLLDNKGMVKGIETKQQFNMRGIWINGQDIQFADYPKVEIDISTFESNVDPNNAQYLVTLNTLIKPLESAGTLVKGSLPTSDNGVVISTGLLKSQISTIKESKPHYKKNFEDLMNEAIGSSIKEKQDNGFNNEIKPKQLVITGICENEDACIYVAPQIQIEMIDMNYLRDYYQTKMTVVDQGTSIVRSCHLQEGGYGEHTIAIEDNVVYLFRRDISNSREYQVKNIVNGEEKDLTIKLIERHIKDDRNEKDEIVFNKETSKAIDSNLIGLLMNSRNNQYNREMIMNVWVNNQEDIDTLTNYIKEHAYSDGNDIEFNANSNILRKQKTQFVEEELNIIGIVVLVMYGLILLISILVIFANFMDKTKEVGIYRAIGVSKSNCVYKYFVETFRTVVLYVLLLILVVGGLFALNSYFPLDEDNPMLNGSFMYLAWWQLGGIVLLIIPFLMLISTLPPLNYVRKSPIKILSEYDM